MENYKEELTSLKEELNIRIDAVIAKIEKPKFEVGDYWEHSTGEICLIFGFEDVHGGTIKCRHISSDSKEFAYHGICTMKRKLTPKEVQEALTNQIEKMFPINTKLKTLDGNIITLGGHSCIFLNNTLYATSSTGDDTGILSDILFKDGIFATPIKTKTIEEIADLIYDTWNEKNCHIKTAIKSALIKEKQTIIETLNNL